MTSLRDTEQLVKLMLDELKVKSGAKGCGMVLQRGLLLAHLKTCPKAIVTCQDGGYGLSMTRQRMSHHRAYECFQRKMESIPIKSAAMSQKVTVFYATKMWALMLTRINGGALTSASPVLTLLEGAHRLSPDRIYKHIYLLLQSYAEWASGRVSGNAGNLGWEEVTNGLKAVVIQLASALDNTERRNEMRTMRESLRALEEVGSLGDIVTTMRMRYDGAAFPTFIIPFPR
ncbi:uncharacterized protein IAS62_002498 [Cryptococcus decagattii]|uniref:RING-type E3 ubiquitin transferase n=1 Tax=Cryptococcus decagattii TaxID=1859122 RepID=A0ABZ2AS34_9TREE